MNGPRYNGSIIRIVSLAAITGVGGPHFRWGLDEEGLFLLRDFCISRSEERSNIYSPEILSNVHLGQHRAAVGLSSSLDDRVGSRNRRVFGRDLDPAKRGLSARAMTTVGALEPRPLVRCRALSGLGYCSFTYENGASAKQDR
jgi:hypothetical protein